MKIHSSQFGDGKVLIESGSLLPTCHPHDHGRLFFNTHEHQFYVYDANTANWFLINNDDNRHLSNLLVTDQITFSLVKNSDNTGRTFGTVILSEDNTVARLDIKSSGESVATGFEIRNADSGTNIIYADDDTFTWMDAKVWTEKNLTPAKFQPRERCVDVAGNYMCSSNELVFVNTTDQQCIIKLPQTITVGDKVTIYDDAGTFDKNPCIINGRGQNVNGLPVDVTLNTKGGCYSFVYQNTIKGWRMVKLGSTV